MVTIPSSEPYIQTLNKTWFQPFVEEVAMLRLDTIHPVVSGNKWYKLKENVNHAIKEKYKGILTFGGAYSNHLIATAAAASTFGLDSIGIVRGKYAAENLTPTLSACSDYGMKLIFISNEEYAKKSDDNWQNELEKTYDGYFIIPEGGANQWGREGAKEIAKYIPEQYTHVCISIGTGTSFTGIKNALSQKHELYGYVPMKRGNYIKEAIQLHIAHAKNDLILFDDWHFGGFGKWDNELINFMNDFYEINDIPLDIVYTGKMMYGVQAQIKEGLFPGNARILCIHTGCLQGNESIQHLLGY